MQTLLYISYSKNSCVVLRVTFDEELWELILNEVKILYDKESPVKPTKTSPILKEIKEKSRILFRMVLNLFVKCHPVAC